MKVKTSVPSMPLSVLGYTVFDTSIGCCGLVWSSVGIAGVQLPEATRAATCAKIETRFLLATEEVPPGSVTRAAAAIRDLLRGKCVELGDIDLDMHGVSPFHRRVYELARAVGPGATTTYGLLALQAGSPGAARAVGQAMGKNPFALIVPCHRVLASDGKLHGFSANGGIVTKKRILEIEGVRFGVTAQIALPLG